MWWRCVAPGRCHSYAQHSFDNCRRLLHGLRARAPVERGYGRCRRNRRGITCAATPCRRSLVRAPHRRHARARHVGSSNNVDGAGLTSVPKRWKSWRRGSSLPCGHARSMRRLERAHPARLLYEHLTSTSVSGRRKPLGPNLWYAPRPEERCFLGRTTSCGSKAATPAHAPRVPAHACTPHQPSPTSRRLPFRRRGSQHEAHSRDDHHQSPEP